MNTRRRRELIPRGRSLRNGARRRMATTRRRPFPPLEPCDESAPKKQLLTRRLPRVAINADGREARNNVTLPAGITRLASVQPRRSSGSLPAITRDGTDTRSTSSSSSAWSFGRGSWSTSSRLCRQSSDRTAIVPRASDVRPKTSTAENRLCFVRKATPASLGHESAHLVVFSAFVRVPGKLPRRMGADRHYRFAMMGSTSGEVWSTRREHPSKSFPWGRRGPEAPASPPQNAGVCWFSAGVGPV
jgi:hypothetical protein